jgi:competence protein ComFC
VEIPILRNKINMQSFISILHSALDILFPETCLGCNKKGSIICERCTASLRKAERETSRGIYAAYDYRDPIIKQAIWRLKYYKSKHLAIHLGAILYEHMLEDLVDMNLFTQGHPILVIPVPVSRSRIRERGYNQARSIAQHFCKHGVALGLELGDNIVMKKKDTLPQARISNRVRRIRNIRNAFELTDTEKVKDRTIIVVDDVTTTGATITEVMSILRASGAKKVVGFAVAH